MHDISIDIEKLYDVTKKMHITKSVVNDLTHSISNINVTSSNLTTINNIKNATKQTESISNVVNNLEQRLIQTQSLLIKNIKGMDAKFNYLDDDRYIFYNGDMPLLNAKIFDTTDIENTLDISIEKFLANNGDSLENLNNYIKDNINAAGYGTRNGVVAAANAIINYLADNYDVKLPYYIKNQKAETFLQHGIPFDIGSKISNDANGRTAKGFDCSGLIAWCLVNGGYQLDNKYSAGYYSNGYLDGTKIIPLGEDSYIGKPGDFICSSEHIQIIVAVENNKYTVVEATGENGVVRKTYNNIDEIRDVHMNDQLQHVQVFICNMDGFYENENNIERAGE